MSELLGQLISLEHEIHHPGQVSTRSRLEQLLHPDFHEVGRSGTPYDRDTVLQYLASVESIENVLSSHHQLTPLSSDSALLTYQSVNQSPDGALYRQTFRSSIWRFCAGSWMLFYHQATPANTKNESCGCLAK